MRRTKTCVICEKQFQVHHGLTKYCSGECYTKGEAIRGRLAAAKYSSMRKRAYSLLQSAIQAGRITRKPCEVCGAIRRIHAHHDDYAAPLDVRWLCTPHHRQHHIQNGPGLNAFCEEISA